jgi:predicted regulator of Ras-like GTPase activity (Roadblock/LC7/MglB family)
MADSGIINLRKLQISELLVELGTSTNGIRSCLLINSDGTTIASTLSNGHTSDAEKFAPMIVTVLTISQRWGLMSDQGMLEEFNTICNQGQSLTIMVDQETALTCICEKNINFGVLNHQMKLSCQKLRDALSN